MRRTVSEGRENKRMSLYTVLKTISASESLKTRLSPRCHNVKVLARNLLRPHITHCQNTKTRRNMHVISNVKIVSRKVKGVPQSQTTGNPRHNEEEEKVRNERT